jgi:lipopolysaccharide biosynthesis protein
MENANLAARSVDTLIMLQNPELDPLFWPAERLGQASAWWGHVPFAHWVVQATNPRVIVELGTHSGVSYAAFCQAVARTGLGTRCHAIDTWRGDHQAGFYGEEVYQELKRFHEERYGSFSTLLRCTFDEALVEIADQSIDLLHIDGLHTYEAVRHDFETWSSKLSNRAVVLFHDTNERRDDFGVWRFWGELRERFPTFEFLDASGLGVLAAGPEVPEPIATLCCLDESKAKAIRERFSFLGDRWIAEWYERRCSQEKVELGRTLETMRADLADRDARIAALIERLATASREQEAERATLTGEITALQLEKAETAKALQTLTGEITALQLEKAETAKALQTLTGEITVLQLEKAETAKALQETRERLSGIERSYAQLRQEHDAVLNRPVQQVGRHLPTSPDQEAASMATKMQHLRRRRAGGWATRAIKLALRKAKLDFRQRAGLYLIVGSGLFDRDWYLSRYPDVRASGMDPALHYLQYGASEGRDPGPQFNSASYLSQHPDVAAAGVNPLVHYVLYDAARGRQARSHDVEVRAKSPLRAIPRAATGQLPRWLMGQRKPPATIQVSQIDTANPPAPDPLRELFDEETYLALNPDVARIIKEGKYSSAYDFFQKVGKHDISWLRPLRFSLNGLMFDYNEADYLADNPDVRILIAQGRYRDGFDHFVSTGHRQCDLGLRAMYGPHRFVRLLERQSGEVACGHGRFLALFAHYDRDQMVDEYVLNYLRALRKAGADIVFITATDNPQELGKVRPFVCEIIIKSDTGRDFGSWYIAAETLGPAAWSGYDYLLFVNDSIYFPVADPAPIFETMGRSKLNLWGLTDSRELGQFHIQSYFLAFDQRAREVVLPQFIMQYATTPYMTKWGQIRSFEFGLTQIAVDAGLSVGAFCPIDDAREEIIRHGELERWREAVHRSTESTNPSHALWDLLITRYGLPGLKVELLRENPQSQQIETWPSVVDRRFLDPAIIARHLERMRGPSVRIGKAAAASPLRAPAGQLTLRHCILGTGFTNRSRLVLLAHYDPHGIIDEHVFQSMEALRACGSELVLVTSGERAQDITRARALCASILVKNDVGRDFGSWYLALREHQSELTRYPSVVWMNDSTYFPLFDPAEMFTKMEGADFDFWGVVDSQLMRWHVMSWFWTLGPRVTQSGFVDWYLREYDPAYTKWDQIRNFEMRVPSMLKLQGYRVGTYIAADEVFEYVSQREPMHPGFTGRRDFTMTHEFWDVIIRRFRCPALKVELLRDNPLGRDLGDVLDFVRQHTAYDPDLISQHMHRIKAGHLDEWRRATAAARQRCMKDGETTPVLSVAT